MRETAEGTIVAPTIEHPGTSEQRRERPMGRAVLIGSIAAAITVFTIVAVGIGATIGNYGAGAVLGAFCAAWVGPGFGVMVAGVMHAIDHDRALAAGDHR